jgi:hypothetical protein
MPAAALQSTARWLLAGINNIHTTSNAHLLRLTARHDVCRLIHHTNWAILAKSLMKPFLLLLAAALLLVSVYGGLQQR